MALNEVNIPVSPEAVFAVLADPRCYGEWVVGSRKMRGVEGRWPEAGSRFHHQVGFGPIHVSDHTEVIESDRPSTLTLRAKARPLGTARVKLLLRSDGDEGTHVTMVEEPADRLTAMIFNPLTHLLVRGRNVESLRRLRSFSVEMATDPTGVEQRLAAAARP